VTERPRQKPRKKSWLDQLGREPPQDERRREPIHLAPVYVLLLLIVVLAVIVTLAWGNNVLVGRFGPNLATEALGILLTVVFVRRFMEQAERSRRLRASIGALRKTRRALQDLVDTWSSTLKGCLPQRERGTFNQLKELASPDNSELLMWCDPQIRRSGTDERWVVWLAQHVRSVQTTLDQIVGTYGGTLDPEYVEALDGIIADPFLRGLVDLTADPQMEPQRWRVALNTVRALRMAHFERLQRIIELHNELAAEVAQVRGKTAGPRTSMLGVQLAPDHDLKIDTALDEGWWRSPPGVAALRMSR
jgi:hypothetical protein